MVATETPVRSSQSDDRPVRRAMLDARRLQLADRVALRLEGRAVADSPTLDAVTRLTASADPVRAERLRPRPSEPAPLVERLAVWALFAASDRAVAEAHGVLDEAMHVAQLATSRAA